MSWRRLAYHRTVLEQPGMPELLTTPAPYGSRAAAGKLHTLWPEVKMPCLWLRQGKWSCVSRLEVVCAAFDFQKNIFSSHTATLSVRPGRATPARHLEPEAGTPCCGRFSCLENGRFRTGGHVALKSFPAGRRRPSRRGSRSRPDAVRMICGGSSSPADHERAEASEEERQQ
jgi:hypothetical protein